MTGTLRTPASLVWLLLMAATCATTWWLAKESLSATIGTVSILVIAAIKARLVLLHFMELKHAPWLVRLLFEVWILIVTAAVLGIYLQTADA
jgi:heme/copper-type cytochrome/quinol oxidase subunit 4